MYQKYVSNTRDISSVSGGQPFREVTQIAVGRVLHREQVRDEQPDQLMARTLVAHELVADQHSAGGNVTCLGLRAAR